MSTSVPLPYDPEDIEDILNDFSDTPWTDYNVPASDIKFAKGEDNITLNKGETHTYQVTISPKDANVNSVTWTSTHPNIATVEAGVVTAVGGGETEIVVSSPIRAFTSKTLHVKVDVPLTSFDITPNGTIECDFNKQYEFTASYEPDAPDKRRD